jgi:hypothetical protein
MSNREEFLMTIRRKARERKSASLYCDFALAIAIVTTTIAIENSASAIEITIESRDENPPIVFVDGSFVDGDYAKFVKATAELPPGTAISLNSNGGVARVALQIGETIHAKKFVTIARALCSSGCALVWLAGTERAAYNDSRIGFHSAYDQRSGQIVAPANAVIGAYLARLGLTDDAIYYLTKIQPNWMTWLDFDTAQGFGIRFKLLEGSSQAKAPTNFWYQYSCPISGGSPCEIPIPKGPFPDALKNYRPVWK